MNRISHRVLLCCLFTVLVDHGVVFARVSSAPPAGSEPAGDFEVRSDGSLSLSGGGAVRVFDTAESLRTAFYRVRSASAITECLSQFGGVRLLVEGHGRDLVLQAPFVVDRDGRPAAATWIAERQQGEVVLRLRLTDHGLHYPVSMAVASVSAAARLLRPSPTAGGGSISGTVRNTNGNGIADASVLVLTAGGELIGFDSTGPTGAYSVSGLIAGSYRIVVFAGSYIPQLYNGISCPDFDCDVASGSAINVIDGANTPSIDLTMASNAAQIAGHVFGPGATPLGGVPVVAYDATGVAQGFATTDAVTGEYRITIPFGGTFYARTFNTTHAGLLDQLYSGIPCTGCDVTTGAPIVASIGAVHDNIDFTLTVAGGRIAGRLTELGSSLPLPSRRVFIYDAAGLAVSYGDTDFNGDYISFQALAPGTYYALASAAGYATQLYDHLACNGCAVTGGTAITVATGATTGNINFALSNRITTVSGLVASAAGTPLVGSFVHFYDGSSHLVVTAVTDDSGHYVATLPQGGTYYARTQNWQFAGYVDQVYSAIDCSGCSLTAGTPIRLATGARLLNVNFALASNGGSITGLISNQSAVPLGGFVQVYGSTGELATYGFAGSNGQYSLIDGLTAGNFFVVGGATGYSSQVYQNRNCGGICDPTTGNAVAVVRNEATPNINFTLIGAAARIAGHVRNSAGDPLAGVDVQIFDPTGTQVGVAASDSSGEYEVVLAAPGTYFAKTNNTAFPQFPNQLYNHLPCDACVPTTGTPIAASVGVLASGIDFDLTTGVCGALAISPATLPDATINVPYSQFVKESNGEPPVTFTLVLGALPTGLSLDPGGEISGTPTTAGSFSFTIKVKDATGCTGTAAYTVHVGAAATSTGLTVAPSSATFGDLVTLTATLSPNTADGTITFMEGAVIVATRTLAGGVAAFSTTFFTAGSHTLTAVYSGSPSFTASTSTPVTLNVQKATPVISWSTPAPIIYATLLSGTQLNATTNVPGTFTYAPPAGTLLDVGIHTLVATFTPIDTVNQNTATASVTIVVNKAEQSIQWATPADITYGTALGTSQLNATVTVPGPAPAGALLYSPAAGAVLDAGTQTLTVTATATSSYNAAHASVSLNVQRATPVFSDLSSPTIVIGTASTTISGRLSAGSLIPPGNVTVTLEGTSQSAAIAPDGTFSATFATGSIMPSPTGYPITFSYPGSANFNSADAVSTLNVTYSFTGGLFSSSGGKAGSTLPIRLQVLDATGANLSSSSLPVVAYGTRPVGSAVWTPMQTTDVAFKYQNASGGAYAYEFKTSKSMTPGAYVLGFTVGSDPAIHTINFTITK